MNKKRIVIFVVFLCCLFFMTTFAGSPEQNTIIATRSVTFIDGYNNTNISLQNIEVGTDATVPEDPYHEGYVFAGWYLYEDQDQRVEDFTNILNNLTVIARYAGDVNGNGIADDEEPRYTVTFIDTFDGRVLGTQEVLVGMNATAPVVPTHDGLVFAGWSTSYINVRGNVTVNTVYNTVNTNIEEDTYYQVTFIDTITNEVVERVSVLEGLSASAPEGPIHEGYAFIRWEGDYANVNSDREVRTVYVRDVNGNGIDDNTEARYQLTVDYVSVSSTNEEHTLDSQVIGLFLSGETYTIPTRIFRGYLEDRDQSKTGSMPERNYTAVITYSVDGEDSNNNGVNDNEETDIELTVNYVRSIDGKVLGSETYLFLDGEDYEISVPVIIDGNYKKLGFTLDETITTTTINGRMSKEETTLNVIYEPINDTNGDGIADEEQVSKVIVNYVYAYDLDTVVNTESHDVVLNNSYIFATTDEASGNYYNDPSKIIINSASDTTETYTVVYRPFTDLDLDGKADEEQEFTVTLTNLTGITIAGNSSVSVPYGEDASFESSINEGYSLDNYTINCSNGETAMVTNNSIVVENVVRNTSCAVILNKNIYNVTFSAINGSISPDSQNVLYLESGVFTVTPNEFYKVEDSIITCDGEIVSDGYTLEGNTLTWSDVRSNQSCSIKFAPIKDEDKDGIADEEDTFVISVNVENGVVSPESKEIEYNGTTTFEVTPNNGYTLEGASVSGEGCSIEGNIITVSNVVKASTCTVTLLKESYDVTLVVNYGNGSTTKSVLFSEGTTFEVSRANEYYKNTDAIYSCDNGVSATLNETATILSVSNVTTNTTCTLTYVPFNDEGNKDSDIPDGIADEEQKGKVVVNYRYEDNTPIQDSTEIYDWIGTSKEVLIPVIDGYTPSQSELVVTILKSNEDIDIVYTRDVYTVTLNVVSGDVTTPYESHVYYNQPASFNLNAPKGYTFNGIIYSDGVLTVNDSLGQSAKVIFNGVSESATYTITLKEDSEPEDGIPDENQVGVVVQVTTAPRYDEVIFTNEIIYVNKGTNAIIALPEELDYFKNYKVTDENGNALTNSVWLTNDGKNIVVKTTQDSPNKMTIKVRLVPPVFNLYLVEDIEGKETPITGTQSVDGTAYKYIEVPENVVLADPYITCDDSNIKATVTKEYEFPIGKRLDVNFEGMRKDATCTLHYLKDENGNGIADSKEVSASFKLVNGTFTETSTESLDVIVQNGGTTRLTVDDTTVTPKFGYALVDYTVSGEGCFVDSQTKEVVLTNASNGKVCTITLSEDEDKNNNGTPDSEEDHYNLNIRYVRVNSNGDIEGDLREATNKSLVAEEPYRIEKLNIVGYTLINENDLNGVMPSEKDMPVDGKKVVLKYRPTGKDTNDNGMNDDDEETYTLRVNYISGKNQDGTSRVIDYKDYTKLLERISFTNLVTVPEEIQKTLDNGVVVTYVLVDKTEATGNMPRKENMPETGVYEIEITYRPEDGKDTNNNGIHDDEEEHYNLTADYVSVSTDKEGNEVNYTIYNDVVIGSYVEGASYVVEDPDTLDLKGYTEKSGNTRSGEMLEGGVKVTLYYTPDTDNNHNGIDDGSETHYSVVVNHVTDILNPETGVYELYKEATVLSVVEDESYNVKAFLDDEVNPYYTSDKDSVSGVMGTTNIEETITYSYNYPVINRSDITTNPSGWTNEPQVTVIVNSKDAAGEDVWQYSFDGGVTFDSRNTTVVSEDAIVSIVVMDKNGKKSEPYSFSPDNIDRIEPVIELPTSVNVRNEYSAVVNIKVTDQGGSGLDIVGFVKETTQGSSIEEISKIVNIDENGNASFEVYTDGNYVVYARDNAGNVTKSSIVKVSGIKKDDTAYEDNGPTVDDEIHNGQILVGNNDVQNSEYLGGWAKVNPKRNMTVTADTGKTINTVRWAVGHKDMDFMANNKNVENGSVNEVSIINNEATFVIQSARYTTVYTVYTVIDGVPSIRYYYCNAYLPLGIFGNLPL